MSTAVLEQELAVYQANKASLLSSAEGKFVLICADQICGTFDTAHDAMTEGYQRFGNVPFLVKLVTKVERPINFVSNILGI